MSYSNIKRFLSAAILVAFTAPTTLAISDNTTGVLKDAVEINGNISLTKKNNYITLSLRDSDVKQVLRMFADKAGMNIVFHSSVEGKVTLDLVGVPVNDAFNLILQVANLNYYKQGNTMIVMSKDSPDNAAYSKQEMMIFPIHYVSASKIASFLNKNVFGMKRQGLSSVDAATVNSATNELIVFGMPSDIAIVKKVIEQFDREPYSKTFTVNHTTPAEMADMICKMLLPSRGSETGAKTSYNGGVVTGAAASASSGSGSSALKLGEGVVACSVATSATNKDIAPFDVQNLSITYFPQRGTITLMGGSETQAQMIEKFIKDNDIKQPQALLEVSIVELSEDGSKTFNNNWSFTSNGWGFTFDGSSFSGGREGGIDGGAINRVDRHFEEGKWVTDSSGATVFQPAQYIETAYKSAMPATTYISWTMNYLIENKKARVLANPKILITNGQESVIDLTEDYIEKVTSEYLTSSTNGTGSTGTAQKNYSIGKDLGIKVTLTPFISPDGYVTINVTPEYSTIAGQVYTASNVSGVNDIAATLLSRRNLDLKNVRIKDGETLILGGLIQEQESKTVSKIPILGDLPWIGTIFRSTGTTKSKSELIIMITPKILNDNEGTLADKL